MALVTLAITIICSIFGGFRGFFSIIPVLLGIIGGYIFAYFQGLVDLKPVAEANGLLYQISHSTICNIHTRVFMEDRTLDGTSSTSNNFRKHIGHQIVLGNVIKRDLIEKPGLHRSIFGDGVAT